MEEGVYASVSRFASGYVEKVASGGMEGKGLRFASEIMEREASGSTLECRRGIEYSIRRRKKSNNRTCVMNIGR